MHCQTFSLVEMWAVFCLISLVLAEADIPAEREKRQAQVLPALLPYLGMTVSGPLFVSLVLAYGAYEVAKAGIKTYDAYKRLFYKLFS